MIAEIGIEVNKTITTKHINIFILKVSFISTSPLLLNWLYTHLFLQFCFLSIYIVSFIYLLVLQIINNLILLLYYTNSFIFILYFLCFFPFLPFVSCYCRKGSARKKRCSKLRTPLFIQFVIHYLKRP